MSITQDQIERANQAAKRVDDWDGADHFDDCPAHSHETHDCSCPDTDDGEDACAELAETECDCYLGAMRDCRASLRALLGAYEERGREIERLRAELDRPKYETLRQLADAIERYDAMKQRAEQAEARLALETKRCADIADNMLRACITDEERDIATTIRNLILAAAQPEDPHE